MRRSRRALISIGKVITASAATVGITFLGISFAKMGVFSTVGVSCGDRDRGGIPRRGDVCCRPSWCWPGRAAGSSRGANSPLGSGGVPASASCAGRRPIWSPACSCWPFWPAARAWRTTTTTIAKPLRPSAPSSIGYAALERHFPISQSIPEYILIQSPRDLRTPQALADLEQMAQRVSQLPNIGLVSGITRPTGEVPQEFRATYQAGIVGDRLAARLRP